VFDVVEIDEANINPIKFNYNTLRSATKNFDDDMILGAGGFGVVYKVLHSTLYVEVDTHWCDFMQPVM
jgi:hypothetical protein